tara:strand:+ start:900 stop:1895 length:996 start_codon:yes stop_codon:yes gene_type:complete
MSRLDNKKLAPIFIIGMPRSGTKLIREILNNHKHIYIPRAESIFLPFLVHKYGLKPNFNSLYQINRITKDILRSSFFYHMKIPKSKIINKELVDVLKSNRWDLIFKYLILDSLNKNINKKIFGDKTPSYINHIDILSKIYPSANFLHIIRDPRDQSLSIKKVWGKNLYRNAFKWRSDIFRCRNFAKENNINYFEVRYEDLITNSKKTMIDVCKYLSCDFSESMLIFNKPVENLGDAKDLYINSNNMNKFKDKLSFSQIKKIEELTLDVMCQLKYIPVNSNISLRKLSLTETYIYKILDYFNIVKFHIMEKGIFKGLRYVYSLNHQNFKKYI